MLRARALREGSVGLLVVAGILLFGGIALWLRGIRLGESNYKISAEFPNVNGMQAGDAVRYRGLRVGRIQDIVPGTNGVEVIMEIDSSKLLIPKDVTIKTSSSGLIGETFIDIRPPETEVTFENPTMTPFGENCDRELVLCDGEKLTGISGITIDDLFPLMYQLTSRLSENPELFDNVSAAAKNSAVAASEIGKLSQDMSALVIDVQSELDSFTDAAKAVSTVAGDASGQINTTALKYQETAEKLGQLVDNVNLLVNQNRENLIVTLDSIGKTSDRLQGLIVNLDAAVAETDTKQLAANLETLTANAADASANLKEISETFADPNSVVTLQQTLDSARVTFANAQKITSDLEEVTGDPSFRNNVRNLVNGLSSLVSFTETLEKQIYTDRVFQDVQQFSATNSNLEDWEKSILKLQKPTK
ncbi:ABC-type transport system involved in resistance to organic solvents, periplasmic component [Hyella patelloides LEGE 07179]|uniref:ABC-type transport system involved in resistance to organic solvents, periplasmic component n=1 Tax=Hyella patelloides LEGE 07179 TaxID=945734 RepID=A0A563VP31_9CYAN|nr:MlaD family protein [Hyella patelloides]VEP13093.1 ABC-type transport system involved in resistance to organic solvents, periplasmic component [Hyella patelloides LEGE 07179]